MPAEILNEEVINILTQIGSLTNWLQALGIVFIFTIIFQIITFMINKKKLKELENIKISLTSVEDKLNKLLSKKKQSLQI
ncbi:MAG: hypothetical protein AABW75_02880 [Nanoarchaeota archaeon]